METYTVEAKELEGVISGFRPHHESSVPVIHHTFNAVYSVDLYETDFHFLFDDVPTNIQTELYKDVPKHLLDYMIDPIKTESESVGTRCKLDKIEKLFGNMQLSYQTSTGKIMNFKLDQKLAIILSSINVSMPHWNVLRFCFLHQESIHLQ